MKTLFCRVASALVLLLYSTGLGVGTNVSNGVVEMPEKTLFLTYDDGPSENVEELLALLLENDVKATFFLVGKNIDLYPQLAVKIRIGGHAIGVHCDEHDYNRLYASEQSYLDDLDRARDKIKKITGRRPNILRFPGGSPTAEAYIGHKIDGGFETIKEDLAERGMKYYDWNVCADIGGDGVISAIKRLGQYCENNGSAIILMHDTQGKCLEATAAIIEWAKEAGYSFGTLDASIPEYHDIRNFS